MASDNGVTVIDESMPVRDAEHIASWHPGVALAVADWLDHEADGLDLFARVDIEHGHEPRKPMTPASAVARAYLAAPVSAGEPKEDA